MGDQQRSLSERRPVHRNSNYEVDREGRIFTVKTGKERSQSINFYGYSTLDLYRDNKPTKCNVHRLVAIAFIPNPENKPCINHIDGNKSNNNVDNLEWCSYSENNHHAFDTGLSTPQRGEDNPTATITNEQAHEICLMIQNNIRIKDIVEELGIAKHIVVNIKSGKTWVHISKDYDLNKSPHKLDEKTVRWICEKIEQGYRNAEIVKMSTSSKVNKSRVSQIKNKVVFKYISKDYEF